MSPPRALEQVLASIQDRKAQKKRRKPRRRRKRLRTLLYQTESLGICTKRKGQVSMGEVALLLGWSTDRARAQLKRDGVARLSKPDGVKVGRYYVYEPDLRRVYPEQWERLMLQRVQADESMLDDA